MAITISGDSPNFTSVAATTVSGVTTLNSSSGVLATQNGMTGIPKAWVNYNGVAQTINGSFNVTSVTYNSTGDYTVNFTTAMPNANYAVSSCCSGYTDANAPTNLQVFNDTAKAPTTTTLQLFAADTNTTNYRNVKFAYVAIFSS